MNKKQQKAIDNLRQKLVEKSKNYLAAAKSNPSHEYTLKLAGLYLMKIEDELDTIASLSDTTEHDGLSEISERVFTISQMRDLNAMVKSGHITSSKMIEVMNEAVRWQSVDLGNKYLRDMISDLKANPEALTT